MRKNKGKRDSEVCFKYSIIEMSIKSKMKDTWIIQNCAFLMDGGTKFLNGTDATGNEINIILPQNGIEDNFQDEYIPGRLHFNGKPINVRSEVEGEIISKLIEAHVVCEEENESPDEVSPQRLTIGEDITEYFKAMDNGPDSAIALMIREIIDFVQSEEYVEIAKKYA
ncbi:MAG: hypothetical protein AAF487_12075 [Bacteroidota bacterium]